MKKESFDAQFWASCSPHETSHLAIWPSGQVAKCDENALSSVEEITQKIESAQIDIAPTYDDWLRLGFSLANELGERGREYFMRISRFYADFNENEADKKFSNCLATGNGSVSIATFYSLVKNAGISIDTQMQDGVAPGGQMARWPDGQIDDKKVNLTLPTFSDKVKDDLPPFLQNIIEISNSHEDADMLILGSITTVSACLPNYSGMYDQRQIFPNLYLFVVAPPSAGKGRLSLCKALIKPIHLELRSQYQEELKEYKYQKSIAAKNRDSSSDMEVPKMKSALFPANSSSAAFCKLLAENKEGGLMFETEGDTLTITLGKDFGNYSDVLRKAFHHEDVSFSRKENDEFVEIYAPKLSVVLSGTPGQMLLLIPNAENGLFSRFMFYELNMALVWKDVFLKSEGYTLEEHFDHLGQKIKELHDKMAGSLDIGFRLTSDQEEEFNAFFAKVQQEYAEMYGDDIIGSVRRLGVITYRIAMVLTALRFLDCATMDKVVYCSEKDFQSSLTILNVLLRHTAKVYMDMKQGGVHDLKGVDILFKNLPETFVTKEAYKIGERIEIAPRSVVRHLSTLVSMGKLQRSAKGKYTKVENQNE